MTPIISALAPIFLLILMGYVVQRRGLLPEAFWAPAERLTYYLFFPALLVQNAARAGLADARYLPMVAALTLGVLIIAGVVILLRPRFGLDGPAFSSVFQGSFRPNTYVAVGAAVALFGEAGLTLIAVCIVVAVPLVNLLGAVGLVRYAGPGSTRPGWRQVIGPVARNPLILACILGALLNVGDVDIPPVISPLLDILGRAALPVGLMAVGAGLQFTAVRPAWRVVAATTAIKLVALPVVIYLLSLAFGVGGLKATVLVMYGTMPGSAVSYVMTRQMGGDGPLMAAIIATTTLAAMAAMPVALVLVSP